MTAERAARDGRSAPDLVVLGGLPLPRHGNQLLSFERVRGEHDSHAVRIGGLLVGPMVGGAGFGILVGAELTDEGECTDRRYPVNEVGHTRVSGGGERRDATTLDEKADVGSTGKVEKRRGATQLYLVEKVFPL